MKHLILFVLFLLCALPVVAQTSQCSTSLCPAVTAVGATSTNNFALTIREIAPGAPTVALAGAGAGNVDNGGVRRVKIEFTTALGHTQPGTQSLTVTVVDKSTNGKVAISAIPTGSVFVTGRKVYATSAGGTTYHLLSNGTIANNTATTLTMNDSDATLNAAAVMPTSNTTSNTIILYDGPTGVVTIPGFAGGFSGTITTNTLAKGVSAGVLGDSQITDDGANIQALASAVLYLGSMTGDAHNVRIDNTGASKIDIDSGAGVTTIGDVNGSANGTKLIIDDAATETVTVGSFRADGVNSTAGISAALPIRPVTAAATTLGLADTPFSSLYIGNAANNSSQITGTFTGNRVATLPDATGTIQLVGSTNTGAILTVPVNNTVLATATGTVFSSPGNDGTALSIATEGNVSFPVTRAGTIRNLFVRTGGTAKVNTPSTVITIRKNGVDTAVTLTMTQTVNTTTSDTAHSFTVVAGDLITVSFATTGAAGVSTSIAGVSFELD